MGVVAKENKAVEDAEHYTYRRKSKAPGDSTKEGWVCTHSQCSARATTVVKDGITLITALTVSMVLNGEQIHEMYMYITKKYLNAHIYIPKYSNNKIKKYIITAQIIPSLKNIIPCLLQNILFFMKSLICMLLSRLRT